MTYRVIQWSTGNVGTAALRCIIRHPELELVGVWVHSAGKAGRDAGELCGLGPTGVRATIDVDEILALGADCVLYMPAGTDVDVLDRLLASGTNVVTTRGDFHRPASMDPLPRIRKLGQKPRRIAQKRVFANRGLLLYNCQASCDWSEPQSSVPRTAGPP